MRYVKSRLKQSNEDLAYRIYITRFCKGVGHLNMDWFETVRPTYSQRIIEDDRDPQDIINHICDGLEKLGKGEDDEPLHTISETPT